MNEFTCRHCNEVKPADEFRGDSRTKHGIDYECKPCRRKRRRTNGEYLSERIRSYGKRSSDGIVNITVEQIESLLQKRHCPYCGTGMTRDTGAPTEVTIDHIYGVEGYGGGNFGTNLMACCRACNSSKGSDHIADFQRRSEKFTDELFRKFAAEFGARLMKRELSEHEAAQMARNFIFEADMLRRNAERKDRAANE